MPSMWRTGFRLSKSLHQECVERESKDPGQGKGQECRQGEGQELVQDCPRVVQMQEATRGISQEEARPSEQQPGSNPEGEDGQHPSGMGEEEPDEEEPKEERRASEEPLDWGGDEASRQSEDSEGEYVEDAI